MVTWARIAVIIVSSTACRRVYLGSHGPFPLPDLPGPQSISAAELQARRATAVLWHVVVLSFDLAMVLEVMGLGMSCRYDCRWEIDQ